MVAHIIVVARRCIVIGGFLVLQVYEKVQYVLKAAEAVEICRCLWRWTDDVAHDHDGEVT